jgi:PAS domain S-box-containing protein
LGASLTAAAQRTPRRFAKLGLPIAWIIVGAAAVATGWFYYPDYRDDQVERLLADAQRSAFVFHSEELNQLTGGPDDLRSPVYQLLKQRLINLRSMDKQVRFCYLLRRTPEGKIVFLGDSEPETSAYLSRPGDAFSEVERSYGLRKLLSTGKPSWEGPLADSFGVWVTGYAVASRRPDGSPQDIFGIDIEANEWRWSIWRETFEAAGYVLLTLGLPLAVWMITQRRTRLLTRIQQLSDAMDASSAAVLVVRLDGSIAHVSQGFVRQSGIRAEAVLGKHWSVLAAPSTPKSLLKSIVRTVLKHGLWRGQWDALHEDGSLYPVYGMISVIRKPSGAPTGYVVVFDDISIIKKAEVELRHAKQTAEAASEAKSRFLATMSHEIRTPLNGILGLASVLESSPLPPEQHDLIKLIAKSGRTLLVVINDILDLSRIEAGRLDLEARPFNIREVVEDSVALFQPLAESKQLTLSSHFENDTPEYFCGDRARIDQILGNFLSNALKFTERGGVRLHVSTPERSADHACLRIAVTDTGPGISESGRAKLFAPFSQVDTSATRKHGGSGLGLVICKRLAELMDGGVACESEPGKGSTFIVTLRLPISEAPVPSEPAKQIVASREAASVRLLLAEDNAVNRVVAQRMLQLLGYTADIASDGIEAVNACKKTPYDIVLMDVQMPNLDGRAASQAIRSDPLIKQPWIIAVTADALLDDRGKCLQAGMNDYISKPLVTETLKNAIDHGIAARQVR